MLAPRPPAHFFFRRCAALASSFCLCVVLIRVRAVLFSGVASLHLARPQKIKQEYDSDTDATYVNADDFADKKSIYVTIVGGLVVVAFVAPMLQFFYYTGGD